MTDIVRHPLDPDPYYDTTAEWGEPDGCLHGVPWCEPCVECEWDDEATWIECGYY